jgi:hypothetical protein
MSIYVDSGRFCINLRHGLLIGVIISLLFFSGCLSPSSDSGSDSILLQSPSPEQPPEPISPDTISSPAPVESPEEPEQVCSILQDSSHFNSISIVVHNITVQRVSKGGKMIPMAFLDLSLRNNAIDRVYSLDYTSLVCIESNSGKQYPAFIQPKSDVLQEESTIPLLPCTLAPGQEKRGMVVFNLLENVASMVLYVKEPDWTVVGEMYIPVVANGSRSSTWREYTKNLEMVVHSAVLKDIPGLNLRQGRKSLVINVSITNHYQDDVIIPRETVFIITELARTFEHGGDRVTEEIARQHLRFPLRIHSGETINGSILFSYGGTRTSMFVLTDRNYVINSIVDLNELYRYE